MRLVLVLIMSVSVSTFAAPAFYTDKVDSTPNICQSCYPDIIQWQGKPHCAPAAVSNSLVWLSKNGFPELQPFHDGEPLADQAKLVNQLGEVMGTTQNGGTSPRKVMTGLKKYLELKKVPYKRMAAVGWRGVPDFVSLDNTKVTTSWIKDSIQKKGSVWILIGWCKYDPKHENCEIYDGHWMTVVGYGKDRSGNLEQDTLIVHDPAERAARQHYYPKLEALTKGTVEGKIPAQDVLSLKGDVIIKPGADLGVIQGAYLLEL